MNDLHTIQWQPSGSYDDLFQKSNFPRKFEFNREVAEVFDNMAHRSIPLYTEVMQAAVEWAYRFYQPETTILDIGCSTGSTLHAMASAFPKTKRWQLVGIDESPAMIAEAQQKAKTTAHLIEFRCQNIIDAPLPECSVVIVNYTLQFLPVKERERLIQKIFQALVPGGILFVSEKIQSRNDLFQEQYTYSYERFKSLNGYTRSEIELKKEALDQVLISFSQEQYHQIFQTSGFRSSETILRWNNFASFVAVKA